MDKGTSPAPISSLDMGEGMKPQKPGKILSFYPHCDIAIYHEKHITVFGLLPFLAQSWLLKALEFPKFFCCVNEVIFGKAQVTYGWGLVAALRLEGCNF